ncbi:hypothetical protein AB4554_06955 [Vibrio breoganii]
MIKKYIATALVLMVAVVGIYIYQFYFHLGYGISNDAADWVNFSDYLSGILGPLFGFLSFVLLVKSLQLQNDANVKLREEAELNKKNEVFRSFESHFFNLLEAQRVAFDNFHLNITINGKIEKRTGVDAVICLEDQIESMRESGYSTASIEQTVESIDSSERIYNTVRVFYNITKMISEKLTDDKGFNEEVRDSQFQTLIAFTEFSQLRLVLIAMQFLDCPSAKHLKSNQDFVSTLSNLGVDIDPY